MKPKPYRILALQRIIYIAVLALVAISIFGCRAAKDSPVYDEDIANLVEQLRDPNPATRSQAADALVDIGAPAVPALVSTLGGSWPYKLETSASGVLAQIGEPAVPALIEALDDKDVVTRRNAVIALAEMRASAGAAVPALIERLEDKILLVRSGAVFALVRIGAETRTSEAVLALLDSMDDESLAPYVESYFFDMGDSAIPALVEVKRHKNRRIRERADYMLGRLQGHLHSPPVYDGDIANLVEQLRDPNPATRSQAADALVDIGAPAVPALVSTLGGSWPYKLETSASGVLAQIGEPAVPALIEALDDKDVVTRYNAVIALAEMRASAGAAVPALIERLEDKILLVRSGAVFALVRIGAETRTSEAVLALLDSMDDKSLAPYVESYFSDMGDSAIPALVEVKRHKNRRIRERADYMLGRLQGHLPSRSRK